MEKREKNRSTLYSMMLGDVCNIFCYQCFVECSLASLHMYPFSYQNKKWIEVFISVASAKVGNQIESQTAYLHMDIAMSATQSFVFLSKA